MMLRSLRALALVALPLCLAACPTTPGDDAGADAGTLDAGNPTERDDCSGGCAANQVCDTANRICVDACGGCDAGTCVKVSDGHFECVASAVQCNGSLCEAGQVACLGGACSCLSSLTGALDTCQGVGKWCTAGACANPQPLQQCVPNDPNAACPMGHLCNPLFGDISICLKACSGNGDCQRGELCAGFDEGNACLPSGLFNGQECEQNAFDAGMVTANRITVPVSNTCLLKDQAGNPTEAAGKGTGNCTYAIFQFWNDGVYPFTTCRPPGQATEGQPCVDDYSSTTQATQCATGLQCVKARGGNDGVCMRMCNAQPPAYGYSPTPACNTDESCVNVLRYQDPNSNAVLGACMKSCNVFDTAHSSCANVGNVPTSCVPTEASGELPITLNGDGICVPQRPTIAALGETCSVTDSFRGAACASGQLCTSLSADAPATCIAVCDLTCNPADGGTGPASCATEPNARCAAGKTCKRVTSTSGAQVGFCL